LEYPRRAGVCVINLATRPIVRYSRGIAHCFIPPFSIFRFRHSSFPATGGMAAAIRLRQGCSGCRRLFRYNRATRQAVVWIAARVAEFLPHPLLPAP